MKLKLLGIGGLVVAGALMVGMSASAESTGVAIKVYKSPTCGCCTKWISHLESEGFEVTAEDVQDMGAVKREAGVPADLGSCHTAYIGDVVVEGHVPAHVIQDFLANKPEGALGISVPGMPIGSPGMEGPNPETYDVMVFDRAGNRGVYETITP